MRRCTRVPGCRLLGRGWGVSPGLQVTGGWGWGVVLGLEGYLASVVL